MAQLLWKTIWQFLKITVVPPLVHSFASHSFTYLWSAAVQKQMTLLTKHQKVNSSLMLHHNAYVIHLTSSYHIGIYHLSSSQEERHSLEVLEHIHVAWKGRTTATMELLYDPAILLLGIHRSTLNIPCHSLLACKVSPEKSADSFTVVPSQFCVHPFSQVWPIKWEKPDMPLPSRSFKSHCMIPIHSSFSFTMRLAMSQVEAALSAWVPE
ncbi:uncharacterized protein LOC121016788 isoform X1 [Herpailurus yagouaroundi]|uniref:uncharacterized protein LOC121016788 isoform X1 n=1 Tax=Herpailurus yagouaroundi TaxID=1608482 RepID=UPI001AD71A6B|nr:uncharacterized protein LOC121016788 isoform X1 [Puma yagouaroundi]